ncbi:MAG: DUF2892 domain-containing protein [Stappiaceae bacterium]
MSIANVGSADRLVRIAIGAVLALLPVLGIFQSTSSTAGIITMIVGIVLILTGFISFCPLYRLIGASTRSKS